MDLNIQKTTVISFFCKTNVIHFNYHVGDELILRPECIKDFGIMMDSKVHFYQNINYISSQALKLLGPIRFITNNFSSLDRHKVSFSYHFN
jgi:hypothetical protein